MTNPPEFALLDPKRLKAHERVDERTVEALERELSEEGVVRDPIWVDRETGVILNGHHRFRALIALGARRIPAWLIDYDDETVLLDRWSEGPPVTKVEVLARARSGRPFPPKTTRHTILGGLPSRPTDLSDLLAAGPRAQPAPPARLSPPRARRGRPA